MSIRVERELAQLNDIFSHLESDATPTEQKAISKAKKKIEALKLDPERLHVRRDALKALDELVSTYSHPTKEINKVKAIAHNILLFSTAEIEKRPPIGLSLVFFCDVDSPDHNGAIHREIPEAVIQGVPFVTTRSLLRYKSGEELGMSHLELILIERQRQWDIFQRGEFILFLPKTLQPSLKGDKKLEALDFAHNGSLKKIGLREAFYEPTGSANFDDFLKLFKPKGKVQKLFYLAGHGTPTKIGGLNIEHYQKFLNFLDHEQCRGLTVGSCSIGGESSLFSLPSEEVKDPLKETHKFPLIVRSIGDYPTRLQAGEENIKLYFEEMAKFAERGNESIPHLRKTLQKVEQGAPKEPSSLVKVYFPHSKGYRPVDETGSSYSLTMLRLKGHHLLLNRWKKGSPIAEQYPSKTYEITNKSVLEVHPLIVDSPLLFKKGDPKLFSMTPGQGHHLFTSLTLSNSTPEQYVKNLIHSHTSLKLKTNKGFFIGSLSHKVEKAEEVAILVGPASYAVFRERERYFFTNGKKTQEISAFEHALYVEAIAKKTIPRSQAVRSTAGEEQSEETFQDALNSPLFCSSTTLKLLRSIGSDKENIRPMTPKETVTYCSYLFRHNQGDLAFEILKNKKIDPNEKSPEGIPLLLAASQAGHYEAVLWLLNEGANANFTYNDANFTQRVILSGDIKLLEILLEHSNLLVQPKANILPITFASTKRELELLISYGASINGIGADGWTPLTEHVKGDHPESIHLFLSLGADPNAGSPSALTAACQSFDPKVVQSLLDAGGTPFKKDASGKVPAIEAILKGSPEIVKLLLARKDCDFEITDASGLSLALAGVISGNPAKIESLKGAGVTFKEKDLGVSLNRALDRLILLKDFSTISKIIDWNGEKSKYFDDYVLFYTFSKVIQGRNSNELKLVLPELAKKNAASLKILTSDRLWNYLVKENLMEIIVQILLHTHFEKEIVEKLWQHAKLEGNENVLLLLEKLGIKFSIGTIKGASYLFLTRNEKTLMNQTTYSIDQNKLANSNKNKFLEFLYSKGLKKTIS